MTPQRWWRKLQEKGAKTLQGVPAGASVGPAGPTWQPLGPPLLRDVSILLESSRDVSRGEYVSCLFCTRVPLFSFPKIHPGKYRV